MTSKPTRISHTIKPGRKKKPPDMVKALDALCSLIAHRQAKGKCEMCRGVGNQTHHFFHKKMHGSVRYDIRNFLWLCFPCHIRKIHQGGRYEEARDALIDRIGPEEFALLKIEAQKIRKFLKPDLLDLHEKLSIYLKRLEAPR